MNMKIDNNTSLSDKYKFESNDIESNKIEKNENANDNKSRIKKFELKIDEIIEGNENSKIPILVEPIVKTPDIDSIMKSLNVDNDNDIYDHVKSEVLGMFNFLSDKDMALINKIISFSLLMVEIFRSSREINAVLMKVQLNLAEKMKDNLDHKARIMVGAAIASAGASIAIHSVGATVSIHGMGMLNGVQSTNPTMIKGNLISTTADPLARVIDQTLQSKGIVLDGEQKVLEARSSINNNVISNNNDIQREAVEVARIIIQAIMALIQNKQEAASFIVTKC
ncbi:type III secretion protein [Proteus sp. GOKU]|uniref:type III secretion protein n=1 Tax=Proteus TaxID=583 RepID=UPI001892B3B1|nr:MULTISPECIES: type III secretion protein [Proteus]QPB80914.1 type III secretion protein [Proteus sp. GOKU]QQP26921.1 type III secretion protein [Proteus vulgaris]